MQLALGFAPAKPIYKFIVVKSAILTRLVNNLMGGAKRVQDSLNIRVVWFGSGVQIPFELADVFPEIQFQLLPVSPSTFQQVVDNFKLNFILFDVPESEILVANALCRQIKRLRRHSEVCLLLFTTCEDKRLLALARRAGFDEVYLNQLLPIKSKTFFANLLSEKTSNIALAKEDVIVGDLRINFQKKVLYVRNRRTRATRSQLIILSLFLKNLDTLITRETLDTLLTHKNGANNSRRINMYVSAVRALLEKSEFTIVTHYGIGYKLIKNVPGPIAI